MIRPITAFVVLVLAALAGAQQACYLDVALTPRAERYECRLQIDGKPLTEHKLHKLFFVGVGERTNFEVDKFDQPFEVSGGPLVFGTQFEPESINGVRVTRCAQTVMTAGKYRKGTSVVTSELGLDAEIRLLADPNSLDLGSDLPIQAMSQGTDLDDAEFSLWEPGQKQARIFDAGADGMGVIKNLQAGTYRLEMRCRKPSGEMLIGSLSFDVLK